VRELDASILADHLRTLKDSRLLRRVGYVLQSQDYSAPKVLGEILNDARQQAQKLDDEESIPLLPGIPGTQLDSHWRLRLP
jgi:phosphoenolpyruvate-protein kinase (PTS system EI component)